MDSCMLQEEKNINFQMVLTFHDLPLMKLKRHHIVFSEQKVPESSPPLSPSQV